MKYDIARNILNHNCSAKWLMNSHKDGDDAFAGTELDILELVINELEELKDAVINDETVKILEESADVVNFIIILIMKRVEKYQNRKQIIDDINMGSVTKQ
jgi:hypothetical protein